MTTQILTPVGRLVQGSVAIAQTEDYYGAPLTYKKGPNIGQPRLEWYVGLAIPKNDPNVQALFDVMTAEATAGFPGGDSQRQDFAWKFIDGDGLDSKGQPFANREGHAGCWIFRFTTGYAPSCFKNNGQGGMIEIPAAELKNGHFARISGTVAGNNDTGKPGLYLNLNMVEWMAFGNEIRTGPNPNEVFSQPAQLPAGASMTPTGAPAGQFEHMHQQSGGQPMQGGAPGQGQPQYRQQPQGQGVPMQQQPQGQPQYQPQGQPQYQPQGHGVPMQQQPQGQPQYQQQPQGQPQYQPQGHGVPMQQNQNFTHPPGT